MTLKVTVNCSPTGHTSVGFFNMSLSFLCEPEPPRPLTVPVTQHATWFFNNLVNCVSCCNLYHSGVLLTKRALCVSTWAQWVAVKCSMHLNTYYFFKFSEAVLPRIRLNVENKCVCGSVLFSLFLQTHVTCLVTLFWKDMCNTNNKFQLSWDIQFKKIMAIFIFRGYLLPVVLYIRF